MMPKKITQAQLNDILAENKDSSKINLRQLLEDNNYKLDISDLYIDGKILSSADALERELNFSGLNLIGSKFVDLEAMTISFAGSNLTDASIRFKSVVGADFSRANLIRCYINELKALSNDFTDAIFEETMIFKKLREDQSFLTPAQVAEVISLDIAPGGEFRQADMINKYPGELQSGGFCVGGGVEFARHTLKAIDRRETSEESSFTAKLARKMANRSENFLKRIYDYQEQLFETRRMRFIDLDTLRSNNFINLLDARFDDTTLLSCWMNIKDNEGTWGHVITVVRLNSGEEAAEGYRILDLNQGEIRCDLDSSEENQKKCNQQVHLLYAHYQANIITNDKSFSVTDLDKLIKDYGLVKPIGKYKKSDKYLDKIIPSRRGEVEEVVDEQQPESRQERSASYYGAFLEKLLGWTGAVGPPAKER